MRKGLHLLRGTSTKARMQEQEHHQKPIPTMQVSMGKGDHHEEKKMQGAYPSYEEANQENDNSMETINITIKYCRG